MLGIKGHKTGYLLTFEVTVSCLFRWRGAPIDIVVVVYGAIMVKMRFVAEPDVVDPIWHLFKPVNNPATHADSSYFVVWC